MAAGGGTYLRKYAVFVTGNLAALHSLPHAIIAALHQPALEPDGITQVAVALDVTRGAAAVPVGEALEVRVELGVAALGEE
ncbi:hypothetical protein BM221_010538 [Beauveria bassiana]|uniref:Uncharacterized protein n=1 Tax=Beauveria bassiana TaxID=176275 RepID=A0A2N6N8R0_BEABA|nr:hypothetical protein BM221_010538 [Beauveria bassiana]